MYLKNKHLNSKGMVVMTKKYIGYIRVSTDEQLNGYGLEAQQDSIINYCKAMGYELERIVVDEGKSGATLEREGIQEVIAAMRQCQYAGVVVYKLDRISRLLKDILNLHDDIFVPCGASIISVKEQFDTQTPMGRLMFQMIGGFAEFEREVIKERMVSGREQKAKEGKFAGGSAPYGYDLLEGKLEVNNWEAIIVKEVFQKRKEGKTLQQIADDLNEGNVPTKRGGKWSKIHVRDMLNRKEFYKGMYKHGNVIAKGEHEPILG